MAEKYYLRGILALVNAGKVHLNLIDEDAMDSAVLEKILSDPLTTSNYLDSIKLRYFPTLSENDSKSSRQTYVELRYGLAESVESKGERGTIKNKGPNKTASFAGYVEMRSPNINQSDKDLLRHALSSYKPKS